MIVSIHQPEHLPWLGFFHKMAQADLYVLLDHVQYRHRYFQNRNRVLGARDPIWLTVPVRHEHTRYGPIHEVRIDNAADWRKSYWGSLAQCYAKHPYFKRYADPLQAIIMAPHETLYELNIALITFFRDELGVRTPMVRASELDPEGAKTDLLHDICVRLGATTYLSGPSGMDYLDESPFRASGIAVRYHDFHHPLYDQLGRTGFTPLLSTLDMLMNVGPATAELFKREDTATLPREVFAAARAQQA